MFDDSGREVDWPDEPTDADGEAQELDDLFERRPTRRCKEEDE